MSGAVVGTRPARKRVELWQTALIVTSCVVVGATVSRSIPLAITAVLAVGLCAVVYRAPYVWLGICLLTLATAPETVPLFPNQGPADHAEIYKGIMLAGVLPMLAVRGFDGRMGWPLGAYAVATALSALAGTLLPDLTATQMLSSLTTLTLAWFYAAVAWDWELDAAYLKIVAWLPLASVAIGVAVLPFGVVNLFDTAGSVARLQGAVIAAMLGGMGAIGASASVFLWRRARWRPAPYVGTCCAAITLAALGRGAIVALLIAVAPTIYRFLRNRVVEGGGLSLLTLLGCVVTVALVVLALVLPALATRSENTFTYDSSTGQLERSATSGRVAAWKEFYAAAEVNLLFGRGMGAGPTIEIGEQGFEAQHNEYLRLLLELGYIGGLLVLGAAILTVCRLVARAPTSVRADAIALALAFAVYSASDNTVTDRHLGILILTTLAIGSASTGKAHPSRQPRK